MLVTDLSLGCLRTFLRIALTLWSSTLKHRRRHKELLVFIFSIFISGSPLPLASARGLSIYPSGLFFPVFYIPESPFITVCVCVCVCLLYIYDVAISVCSFRVQWYLEHLIFLLNMYFISDLVLQHPVNSTEIKICCFQPLYVCVCLFCISDVAISVYSFPFHWYLEHLIFD
jgi:hypothetical protein